MLQLTIISCLILGGKHGVYDIDELITLLRSENAIDICTIYVPPERQYVDYMVIVSGLSVRHIQGVASRVRKYVSNYIKLSFFISNT